LHSAFQDRYSQQKLSELEAQSKWKLRFVTLGLGVRGNIGIPHILSFAPSAKTQFTFQLKNKKPGHDKPPFETELTNWAPRQFSMKKAALPSNWYQLPEELPKEQQNSFYLNQAFGNPFLPPGTDTEDLIRETFSAVQGSLEESLVPGMNFGKGSGWGSESNSDIPGDFRDPGTKPSPPSSPQKINEKEWRWVTFGTGFGVSLTGLFGVTYMGADSSILATWIRKGETPPDRTANNERGGDPSNGDPDEFNIQVHSENSPNQLWLQLEKPYRAALATRRISNPTQLQNQLRNVGEEFLRVSQVLEQVDIGRAWYVNAYILTVSISGSGQVTPATGVGGVVTLTFTWKRPPHKIHKSFISNASKDYRLIAQVPNYANNLRNFVRGLSEDISEVLTHYQQTYPGNVKNRFEPRRVVVGLGISAKGDVGIAHLGSTLSGHLSLLKRSAAQTPAPKRDSSNQMHLTSKNNQLFYFNKNPSQNTLDFANRHGILFDLLDSNGTFLFDLHRQAFRGGLAHALRLENYFAEKAAELGNKEWSINDLTAAFTLSVGGAFAIVAVGGTESIAITFSREPVYKNQFTLDGIPSSKSLPPSHFKYPLSEPIPQAIPKPLLANYLENKILDIQQALGDSTLLYREESSRTSWDSSPEYFKKDNSSDKYKLFLFNLTLAPGITFGYHSFLGITLSPILSFSWLK